MISIPKYFVLPPANWVIAAATLYVPLTGNISPSEEKPYKVLMPGLGSDIKRYFYLPI